MLCIQKPIRADDFVTAQKKRAILTGGIIALLIVCAVAARVITRGHRDAVYFLPVSLLRSFIYIGLTTWWGVSLWQRIVQAQVRRYLAATAALCVFWLSIRISGTAIISRCCSFRFYACWSRSHWESPKTIGFPNGRASFIFQPRCFCCWC